MIQNFFQLPKSKHSTSTRKMQIGVVFLLATYICLGKTTFGQVASITSSGLDTNVVSGIDIGNGVIKIDIVGGTRPDGGSNLFHSFGEFNVQENHIANFLNDSGLPTSNILSRVTGGNPSNILGTIQTEGFGNANLFLMNPAGIVFGSDATLNVGGATYFTTTDYLRLADGVQFTAVPSAQDVMLSVAPVAAFGFLGTNPGAISAERSALSVSERETLSLVGGNVTIRSGLNAPGGQIVLVSVASPGEVLADTYASASNVNGESFATMGNITLSEGTTLDVSGDAAGTVIIQGGELMITNATISANTGETSGTAVAIDINIEGNISITSDTASVMTAKATGTGDSGEVNLQSGNLTVESFISDDVTAIIDTSNSGVGNSGRVHLKTEDGNLIVDGGPSRAIFIESGSGGDGNGGNVTITGGNIEFISTKISTGDFNLSGLGAGGTLEVHANSIKADGAFINTTSKNGRGGDLFFEAENISLVGANIGVLSLLGESQINFDAEHFVMDQSTILNQTALAEGGGITISARSVNLMNHSQVASQTFGDGDAGPIRIFATDHVTFSDDGTALFAPDPGGLFTNSFGDPGLGMNGNAGAIEIDSPMFTMTGGTRLNSTTESNGRGGDVKVMAQKVLIDGQRKSEVFSEAFGLGSTRASGIYTRTVGGFCSGFCGDSGDILIEGETFELANGAVLDSGTTSNGRGGAIFVGMSQNISLAGTLDDGTPGGIFSRSIDSTLDPGQVNKVATIFLDAGKSFFVKDGANVSASSLGPANAGDIQLTATDVILLDGATVTTEAAQASGGNIELKAEELIRLNKSTIASSVQGDENTVGGDIDLDPEFIILQNSQILANAVEGQGGNISLVATNAVLVDPFSRLDASSALGVSGSVDIQAPIQNLSGTIAPLPEDTVPVTALYSARCAAGQSGHFSTFVDSKADSLSPTPGRLLASPLLSQAVQAVANTSNGLQNSVVLTASIAPMLLGQTDVPATACP